LACWLSVLLLQKSSVVFCTGMHETDKIEYSRGCSVNFCEYSILIFYLVVFFSSGRPMVIFSLACLVLKNILSFGRSLYIYIYIKYHSDTHAHSPNTSLKTKHANQDNTLNKIECDSSHTFLHVGKSNVSYPMVIQKDQCAQFALIP